MSNSDWDDDEFSADASGDDASDTLPCPNCGQDVYEDAPQCPSCGHYVTHDTRPLSGRPAWWVVLGLIGAAALVWLLVTGGRW